MIIKTRSIKLLFSIQTNYIVNLKEPEIDPDNFFNKKNNNVLNK